MRKRPQEAATLQQRVGTGGLCRTWDQSTHSRRARASVGKLAKDGDAQGPGSPASPVSPAPGLR